MKCDTFLGNNLYIQIDNCSKYDIAWRNSLLLGNGTKLYLEDLDCTSGHESVILQLLDDTNNCVRKYHLYIGEKAKLYDKNGYPTHKAVTVYNTSCIEPAKAGIGICDIKTIQTCTYTHKLLLKIYPIALFGGSGIDWFVSKIGELSGILANEFNGITGWKYECIDYEIDNTTGYIFLNVYLTKTQPMSLLSPPTTIVVAVIAAILVGIVIGVKLLGPDKTTTSDSRKPSIDQYTENAKYQIPNEAKKQYPSDPKAQVAFMFGAYQQLVKDYCEMEKLMDNKGKGGDVCKKLSELLNRLTEIKNKYPNNPDKFSEEANKVVDDTKVLILSTIDKLNCCLNIPFAGCLVSKNTCSSAKNIILLGFTALVGYEIYKRFTDRGE